MKFKHTKDMHMKPEQLSERLQKACGDNLRSVILYGSAAAGDYTGKHSDYNILAILRTLDPSAMRALSDIARVWDREGNPPPLLFTEDRLRQSADVFPIELLDIKDCHRVLHGEELLDTLAVNRENLRIELEHELKGKLIQLRQQYLLLHGRSRPLARLLIDSIGQFMVLARAALRLFQDDIPARKPEALEALAGHIDIDRDAFMQVYRLKTGDVSIGKADVHALFERYFPAVEQLVDAVDRASKMQPHPKGEHP